MLIALIRHFFGRFFDNEFVAQNADMQVTVTKILALLASPGLLLPWFRYTTYLALDHADPALRSPVLWFDRLFFISFAMLVMGGVTVLEWEALFPDRRDYHSLIPLPIRLRTIFFGKVGALILFLVVFTAAVNLPAAFMFPLIAFRPAIAHQAFIFTLVDLARTMAIQFASVLAASAFVYLSLVALEGVMLNVLSVAWFRKASVYIQCAMIAVLLSGFFLFPDIAGSIAALKASHARILFVYPPVWFLGLNEALLGSRDTVFLALARYATEGLGTVTLLAALSYTIAYRRHVRRTLESIDGAESQSSQTPEWLSRLADRLAPRPVERASFAFIAKTIARSTKHRIFLAVYIGVGAAFVLQGLAAAGLKQAWLSVPLVLSFFVLSGMRYIFTIPADLPSNWLFRLSENHERRHALDGVRKAMITLGLAPLFALLAPFYFLLWSPPIAFAHFVFSLTISVLLTDLLLFDFWKIPFTCSYPPGKANVTLLWIFYWLAFTSYAYSMASLEAWMVRKPWTLAIFYSVASVIFAAFRWQRRRWDRVGFLLVFEDALDPVVRTLNLAEPAWRKGMREPQVSRPRLAQPKEP